MLFSKATTDAQQTDCTATLQNMYAGVEPTACFVIGSAPNVPVELIDAVIESPLMKLACNLSGRDKTGKWFIKPNVWTAYDPSARFPRSIYTDPSIMKFVNRHRILDLVSDGDEKMCEMPNTFFYTNELREYSNFFDATRPALNNSLDSFIQLLDIGFRLGFRTFICVGVDLAIRPSEQQIAYAQSVGVNYDRDTYETVNIKQHNNKPVESRSDLLKDFMRAVSRAAFDGNDDRAIEKLLSLEREHQYSFDEHKSFHAAMSSDVHYFDRSQYLRLARKNMSLNGIKLYCTSTTSRLYPYFEMLDAEHIRVQFDGDPAFEDLTGLYSGRYLKTRLPFHRDVKPYDFPKYLEHKNKPCCGGCADKLKLHGKQPIQPAPEPVERDGMVLQQLNDLKNADVQIVEEMN